jgi:hypothetical protein
MVLTQICSLYSCHVSISRAGLTMWRTLPITVFVLTLNWMRTCLAKLSQLSYSPMTLAEENLYFYQSFNLRDGVWGAAYSPRCLRIEPWFLQGVRHVLLWAEDKKLDRFKHQSCSCTISFACFNAHSPTSNEVWRLGILAFWVLLCPPLSTWRARMNGQGLAPKINSSGPVGVVVHCLYQSFNYILQKKVFVLCSGRYPFIYSKHLP